MNTALNESSLLAAEVDESTRTARLVFSVLTLPEDGPEPADPRLTMILKDVARIRASLRLGAWNARFARVVHFPVSKLNEVVQSFGGTPIYGWDFIDAKREKWFSRWWRRTSLNRKLSDSSSSNHNITVFQEEDLSRYLEVTFWFEDLVFENAESKGLPVAEVIAGGKRWWDGFFNRDPRTTGHAMAPLA